MIDNNYKEFIYRHIGPSKHEQKKMLKDVGYSSLDDLLKNTVPEKIEIPVLSNSNKSLIFKCGSDVLSFSK